MHPQVMGACNRVVDRDVTGQARRCKGRASLVIKDHLHNITSQALLSSRLSVSQVGWVAENHYE